MTASTAQRNGENNPEIRGTQEPGVTEQSATVVGPKSKEGGITVPDLKLYLGTAQVTQLILAQEQARGSMKRNTEHRKSLATFRQLILGKGAAQLSRDQRASVENSAEKFSYPHAETRTSQLTLKGNQSRTKI